MIKQKCPYKKSLCEFKGISICPFPNEFKEDKCIYCISPCDKCPLKNNQYKQFGQPESGVMIISGSNYDAPVEAITALLNDISSESNLLISYYYTTAVKCITDKKPSMALIKRCNSYLKKELSIIKPKYVLIMGDVAFKALLWDFELVTSRKSELDSCAGSHIEKDGVVYFITYDFPSVEKNYTKRYAQREHLKKFIQLVNGKVHITPTTYKEIESEAELIYITEEAKRGGKIAVDIETDPLTAFLSDSELLTMSFTVKEGESFCAPLSFRTGNYFKKWNFRPKMNPLLSLLYIKKILTNPSIIKIFHNASYDITWLEHILGFEIKNYDDTMIMKFLMNQNDKERKGLKPLTKQYLDMGCYDYGIKQYVGDGEPYSNIPPHVLMNYNNADTDATFRLWSIFKPKIKELQLEDIHYKFMIPNLRGIINLQKSGIALDVNKCMKMKNENENKLTELFSELRTISQVADFERLTSLEFKPSSPKHKLAMVYGGEITTNEEVPREIHNGKKIGKKEYKKLFYNGFNLSPITVSAKSTVTGKREQRKSFGKVAIQKYLKSKFKGVEYLDPINTFNLEPLPNKTDIMKFIKVTSKISTIQTQLSNHIEPFINTWSKTIDKCVHTSYDPTGTTTGRLNCIAKGSMISYPDKINNCIGLKKIEDVRIGDEVYTFNDENECLVRKVKWAGRTGYEQCLTLLYRLNGKSISLDTTYDHKIRLLSKGWQKAIHLDNSHKILALGRDYLGLEVPVTATIYAVQQSLMKDVYNLEVEETHRYIANGICVKNSRAPNLQNLKREGFVKEAFVSRWGDEGILLESDYKQLELFIMAIVSQDPKFVYAFTHGIDLHTKVAANIIFHVPEEKVTKQMRTMAKTVNFGMIYGKTAFTLCDDLNVSEEKAEEILQGYFVEYRGVKNYCDAVKNKARADGYVTTIMGRRRYLDYSDPNGADRQAVNTTIQSPASDVCVTAVNQLQVYYAKVAQSFKPEKEVAIVCGTVHDSIIIDCKKEHINDVIQATKLIMENTNLNWVTIPLKVDIKYGPNLRNMEEWDGETRIEL